ncbi:MAG: hypothetical protein EBR86_01900 [Planctomycetia bacterium]|nr:hypothetical protein [Planctomycetia bacterium]
MPSSAPAASAPTWRNADQGFTCSRQGVTVTLDPDHPEAGIQITTPSSSDRLLGLDIDAVTRATDHWVRGDDLTAVYDPADARRLRATAMWRCLDGALDTGPAAAWMLVASAQTALLDSQPQVEVVTRVTAGTIHWGGGPPAGTWQPDPFPGARAVLLGSPGGRSTLVAVHPDDLRGFTASAADGRITVRCGLFGDHLEKGVLLRGRVLAAVGPAADAAAWGSRLLARFTAAPPPLTT